MLGAYFNWTKAWKSLVLSCEIYFIFISLNANTYKVDEKRWLSNSGPESSSQSILSCGHISCATFMLMWS